MNTVNMSTGYSPIQLHLGRSPRLIPPLVPPMSPSTAEADAGRLIRTIDNLVADTQDHLLSMRVNQAFFANRHRGPEPTFNVGDMVMLSTRNHCWEYKSKGDKRVAK
ncbi:hypothetical protein GLOTRDRAFT_14080, partial [Gloeophyllum trabeum ATCC 11539]